MVIDILLNNKR